MIASISGTVIYKNGDALVVDINGVGYKVWVLGTISSKTKTGEPVTLLTHLAVREDSLDLYGFSTEEELTLFEKLITVSGIGPKSARAILNLAPVSNLVQAIASGDASYLTRVSGIGKKSAAKIILELKDTLGMMEKEGGKEVLREEKDVLEALEALGFGASEAREALQSISNKSGSTGEKIKEALRLLSR